MKKCFLVIGVFACLGNITAQELSNAVKAGYSDGVIEEVFNLVYKTSFSEAEQLLLANFFTERDSVISQMLKGGELEEDVIEVKSQYENVLDSMLSVQQRYDIYVANKKEGAKYRFSYSQFAIALRYKSNLSLTGTQEEALFHQIDTLKRMRDEYYIQTGKGMDTRAYESEIIAQILTSAQYDSMLVLKNKSKAEAAARKDWKELEERLLSSEYDENEVIQELTSYYLTRECIYDKYQHNPTVQQEEVLELRNNRPLVLKALQKSRQSPGNDTLNGSFNGG